MQAMHAQTSSLQSCQDWVPKVWLPITCSLQILAQKTKLVYSLSGIVVQSCTFAVAA